MEAIDAFPGAWIVLVAMCASRVEAQYTAAIGLTFDPSVRDAGMAGAAAASFWTNGEASWCNPALLGSVRGIGYDYSHTQLVPSLADDSLFPCREVSPRWVRGRCELLR